MVKDTQRMKAHFVTFYSPGTFVAETTTKPIPSWDVDLAVAMASDIRERHGALAYGFRFSTRARHCCINYILYFSLCFFLPIRTLSQGPSLEIIFFVCLN